MDAFKEYSDELLAYVEKVSPVHTPYIAEAIKVAAICHEGQKRRDSKGKETPYILHPLRVALSLTSYECINMQFLAAALLHDTVEDAPEKLVRYVFPDIQVHVSDEVALRQLAYKAISAIFGESVTSIVKRVTNPIPDPHASKAQKRAGYAEHAETSITTVGALLVKACDMDDNGFKLEATSNPSRRRMVHHLATKYVPVTRILLTRLEAKRNILGLPEAKTVLLLDRVKDGRKRLCELSKLPIE